MPLQDVYPDAEAISPARPSISLVAFSYKGVAVLETLCQKVYFPLEPPPAGSTTFFYGFLYFVIRDYWGQQDPALREYDAQAMIDLCETRFCAGLEKFETLTVPVMPNIQALLLGVSVINMLQLLHILTRLPGDQSTGRMQVIFELDVLVRRCHHVSYPWLPSQIFARSRRPRICGYQATYVLATIHVGQESVSKSWTRIELPGF